MSPALLKTVIYLLFFFGIWCVPPIRLRAFQWWEGANSFLERRRPVVLPLVLLFYAAINAALQWHHELWEDEGQAWLIARDAPSLGSLFSLMGYEGTPGLWHLLLYPFAQAGAPYPIISVVNGLLAAAAIATWLYRAPFPLLLRILLPFSYFFLWEYSVNARSYALSLLLLFAGLSLFSADPKRWVRWSLPLFLLANTNLHSLILCAGFGFFLLLERPFQKGPLLKGGIVLGTGMLLALAQVLPPDDLALSFRQIRFRASYHHAANSVVTGAYYYSLFVYLLLAAQVVLSLRRLSLVLPFLLVQAALFSLFLFKYEGFARHHGFLFVSMLLFLWLQDGKEKRRTGPVPLFLFLVLVMQAASAMGFGRLEIRNSLSQAGRIAAYVEEKIKGRKTLIMSYPDNRAWAIAPFLPGRQFFYLGQDNWGTYMIWNRMSELNRSEFGTKRKGVLYPQLFRAHQVIDSLPPYERVLYFTDVQLPQDSLHKYGAKLDTLFDNGPDFPVFSRSHRLHYLYELKSGR